MSGQPDGERIATHKVVNGELVPVTKADIEQRRSDAAAAAAQPAPAMPAPTPETLQRLIAKANEADLRQLVESTDIKQLLVSILQVMRSV
jgi:hypothetical protein